MGRLTSGLITPVCLAVLSGLAGCAAPGQNTAPIAGYASTPSAPPNLIGSTPQILSAAFGQPNLLRVDGTAQVWLYQSASCGLNLFLYPDASGVPRVTMATASDGNAVPGDCPASLQQSHIDAVTTLPADAALSGQALPGQASPIRALPGMALSGLELSGRALSGPAAAALEPPPAS